MKTGTLCYFVVSAIMLASLSAPLHAADCKNVQLIDITATSVTVDDVNTGKTARLTRDWILQKQPLPVLMVDDSYVTVPFGAHTLRFRKTDAVVIERLADVPRNGSGPSGGSQGLTSCGEG